ncbi:DSCAM [Mytilus coruscus]|uniref:DSCAM n=1 Tax=Mytilus coruscus TaxID=42192 RepID=A0A6J8BQE3_MYTCO|nr:DSCAM [Mytilus coruscus]
MGLTVTATEGYKKVDNFAELKVDIVPKTDGVTGHWTIADMSGNSKIIVIDGSKYTETPLLSSIELFIFPAETSDIGFYVYHATDGVEIAENEPITLIVTGKPKVSTSMSKETVDIGQTLTLNCSYMKYDPPTILSVKWSKNSTSGDLSYINESLTSKYGGSNASNPSLTIMNIDSNDLGGYRCEVENNQGIGTSPYITIELSQGDEMCPCNCEYRAKLDYWATKNLTNYTFEELKIILKPELIKLEKELRVDKHNLSATLWKLTSAHDKRPSSRHIGSFGIVFLIFLCLLIFASDLISIKQHIITIKRMWNIKVKR